VDATEQPVSTTTYLGRAALDQIEAAQAAADQHATLLTGICASCGKASRCAMLRTALSVLDRYGTLPRRRPGATIPHMMT
jgi:hypothetical protein